MLRLLIVLSMALLLAACGGGDSEEPEAEGGESVAVEASNTPSEEEVAEGLVGGETPSFEEQINSLLTPSPQVVIPTQTPASEGALAVPLPGTMVASETEEADPIPDFDRIYLRQEGGPRDTTVIVEIFGDGRVVQGENTYFATETEITQLNELIREINFFGMQATFLGPASRNDDYSYRVAVRSGAIEKAVQAQDGYMPDEFMRFMGTVRSVADAALNNAQAEAAQSGG